MLKLWDGKRKIAAIAFGVVAVGIIEVVTRMIDGIAGIGIAIPLLLFLRWRGMKKRPALDALDAQPEEA
jgi:hypothetical protein